eukprot:43403-Pelagomonas_calceolata.AAC.3
MPSAPPPEAWRVECVKVCLAAVFMASPKEYKSTLRATKWSCGGLSPGGNITWDPLAARRSCLQAFFEKCLILMFLNPLGAQVAQKAFFDHAYEMHSCRQAEQVESMTKYHAHACQVSPSLMAALLKHCELKGVWKIKGAEGFGNWWANCTEIQQKTRRGTAMVWPYLQISVFWEVPYHVMTSFICACNVRNGQGDTFPFCLQVPSITIFSIASTMVYTCNMYCGQVDIAAKRHWEAAGAGGFGSRPQPLDQRASLKPSEPRLRFAFEESGAGLQGEHARTHARTHTHTHNCAHPAHSGAAPLHPPQGGQPGEQSHRHLGVRPPSSERQPPLPTGVLLQPSQNHTSHARNVMHLLQSDAIKM